MIQDSLIHIEYFHGHSGGGLSVSRHHLEVDLGISIIGQLMPMDKVVEKVEELRDEGRLPGIPGGRWSGYILVDCPNVGYPCLINPVDTPVVRPELAVRCVRFNYFNPDGSYHSDSFLDIELLIVDGVIDPLEFANMVSHMRFDCKLPGVEGGLWRGAIHVEVEGCYPIVLDPLNLGMFDPTFGHKEG